MRGGVNAPLSSLLSSSSCCETDLSSKLRELGLGDIDDEITSVEVNALEPEGELREVLSGSTLASPCCCFWSSRAFSNVAIRATSS